MALCAQSPRIRLSEHLIHGHLLLIVDELSAPVPSLQLEELCLALKLLVQLLTRTDSGLLRLLLLSVLLLWCIWLLRLILLNAILL